VAVHLDLPRLTVLGKLTLGALGPPRPTLVTIDVQRGFSMPGTPSEIPCTMRDTTPPNCKLRPIPLDKIKTAITKAIRELIRDWVECIMIFNAKSQLAEIVISLDTGRDKRYCK